MKNFYVENKPDGSVRYRMSYKDPLTAKTKRVTVNYDHDSVRNRRRAEEELAKKIEVILNQCDYSELTLAEIYKMYSDHVNSTLKSTTARRNLTTIKTVFSAFPQTTRINNIPPALWKDKMLTIARQKNGNGTYNEYVTRIKAFLRWCYKNDYLDSTECIDKLATLPTKSKREKVADKFLEFDEATALISAMEGMTQWQLMTRFLVLSGLRIGEAIALDYTDIDDTYIHVTETYDYVKEVCTTTKTFTSTRDVAIQDELRECLQDIYAYNEWFCVTNRIDNVYLFPDADGGRVHYDAYRKYLKETAEKVTYKKVTPHTLRHTHISLMFAAGLSLDIISRRVGHDGSKVTKEIYLHITERLKKNDADAIKNIKVL